MKEVLLRTSGGLDLKLIREGKLIELYFGDGAGRYRLIGVLKGQEFWRAIVDLFQEGKGK